MQLFEEHSITLLYVTGMRKPVFVRVLLLLLARAASRSKIRLRRSPSDNFSEVIVTFGSLSLSFLPMSSSPGLMPVTECGVVR